MSNNLQEQIEEFKNQEVDNNVNTIITTQLDLNPTQLSQLQTSEKTILTATFVDNDFGNDLTKVQFAANTTPIAPKWTRSGFSLDWEPAVAAATNDTTHTAVWNLHGIVIVTQVPMGGWGGRPPRPIVHAGILPNLGESITLHRGSLNGIGDDPIGLWHHVFIGWFADRPSRGTFSNPLGTVTDFTLLDTTNLRNSLVIQERYMPQNIIPLSDISSSLCKIKTTNLNMDTELAAIEFSDKILNSAIIRSDINSMPINEYTQGWNSKCNNNIVLHPGIKKQIAAIDSNGDDSATICYYKLAVMQEHNWVSLDDGSENGVQSDFMYEWCGGDAHRDIPLLVDTSKLPAGTHRAAITALRYDEISGATSPYVVRALKLEMIIERNDNEKEQTNE